MENEELKPRLNLYTTSRLWADVHKYRVVAGLRTLNDAVVELVKKGLTLSKEEMDTSSYLASEKPTESPSVFEETIRAFEQELGEEEVENPFGMFEQENQEEERYNPFE